MFTDKGIYFIIHITFSNEYSRDICVLFVRFLKCAEEIYRIFLLGTTGNESNYEIRSR